MKKTLLFASAFIALCSLGNAQVKYADFETFSPFLEGFGGSTYDVVDNPSKTGINTSAKVAKTVHGGETWAGLWGPVGGNIKFDATNHVFKMKVYCAKAGEVMLKFENFDNKDLNSGEIKVPYTTEGAWQELTFDLGTTQRTDLSKIVLFPGNGSTSADVWYYDDIEGVDYTPVAKYDVLVVCANKSTTTPVFKAKLGTTEIALTDDGKNGDVAAADGKFSGTFTSIQGTDFKTSTGKYAVSILADGKEVATENLSVWGTNPVVTLNTGYAGAPLVDDNNKMSALQTTTAPTIDGVADDVWANQPVHNQLNRIFKGTLDLSASFKMMWDENNLYILQNIADATPSATPAAGTEWNFDCTEVFFDMDLSGQAVDADGKYDGVNDWQIRYNRGMEANTVTGSAAVSSADGFARAQKENTDAKGYVMEWKIPFAALDAGFTAENGAQFAFCINTSDNTGAARTDGASWSAKVDDAYQNTKSFGVVTLSDGSGTAVKQNAASVFGIYPNPATTDLKIRNIANVANVTISDLSGRPVMKLAKTDIAESISVSNLNSGMYIITVTDVKGNSFSSKFVKK